VSPAISCTSEAHSGSQTKTFIALAFDVTVSARADHHDIDP
jgi:hypothetical protein